MRRYFIAGLLIWIPLGITIWVLKLIIDSMDQTLLLLPEAYRPEALFGRHIPGLGVVLTGLIVLATGILAANYVGRRLVGFWEAILGRIPIVAGIYNGVKQVSETLFSSRGEAFRKALLVEFPRAGSWMIAFQTGTPGGELAARLDGDHVCVYVPTTPNPTSGYVLLLPKKDVIELDMSVDAALKYIISLGVLVPEGKVTSLTAVMAPANEKIRSAP